MYNVTRILYGKIFCQTLRHNIMQAANAPFCARHSGGSLRHIWLKKRPASRKSVMPHSGRILCRDVIPSAVRSGGPRRAYRTRALRMRHEIIFRSRTGLLSPPPGGRFDRTGPVTQSFGGALGTANHSPARPTHPYLGQSAPSRRRPPPSYVGPTTDAFTGAPPRQSHAHTEGRACRAHCHLCTAAAGRRPEGTSRKSQNQSQRTCVEPRKRLSSDPAKLL